MNVLFISLGCDKNRVDSEYMLGKLVQHGFTVTDDEADADVIVVNTCCFILAAKEESIETILEMAARRAEGSCKALLVCGCLAERYREEIRAEIPEVDAVLGTNATEQIVAAIQTVLDGQHCEIYEPLDTLERHTAARCVSTGGYSAYLKIAEGCDKRCTYCIIPSLRGPYRSVPMEDLLKEAKSLAAQGVKELILVAQETTLYGIDLYGEKSLHRLLRALNEIDALRWIRLLYCYPEEIDAPLIAAMRDCEKVCRYLDLPIQHCNTELLRRMGRRTDRESLTAVVGNLREALPDITLRTTVLCGFPGETQAQHEELLDFIDEMAFDRLGAFAYSAEEGTPAAAYPGQVPKKRKERWRNEVMERQRAVSRKKNETFLGRDLLVLVEGKVADEDVYIGRSVRDAPEVDGSVFIETDEMLLSGDFAEITVTGADDYDLIGVPAPKQEE